MWSGWTTAHVGVHRHDRAVAARHREVGLVELLATRERGPRGLGAPDEPSWSPSGCRSQTSMVMRSAGRRGRSRRRASPRGVVAGRTQTCSSSASVSSALTLAVPSLKPNRLRGVSWLVLVDEVRPKPSCDQRTETVPKPIRARLRIACTATCGSSAQAWTHRSPPRPGRVEHVAREVRQVAQRRRAAVGEAEPVAAVRVAEERRAEADGDRQARTAGSPIASPVSSGGSVVGALDRSDRAGRLAAHHPGARRGPRLQQRDQLVARRRSRRRTPRSAAGPAPGSRCPAGAPPPGRTTAARGPPRGRTAAAACPAANPPARRPRATAVPPSRPRRETPLRRPPPR